MQIVVLAHRLVRIQHENLPALLVGVKGCPLADHLLDRFVASGARSVVMCVGDQGEEIETHVRRALDRGLMVAYSYQGENPTGTGGALRRAYARLEDEFVLTYGDRYLPFDYAAPLHDLRAHPEALGTLVVSPSGGLPANVELDGDWVRRVGQGGGSAGHRGDGALALRRTALDGIEDGAVWELEALLRRLAEKRRLRALVAPEPAYDVGTSDGRDALAAYLG